MIHGFFLCCRLCRIFFIDFGHDVDIDLSWPDLAAQIFHHGFLSQGISVANIIWLKSS